MILVIGQAEDDHIRYVIDHLDRRGVAYFAFDPRQFPTSVAFTIEYSADGTARRILESAAGPIDLDEVRAVWHRWAARPVADRRLRADQTWWVEESCSRFLAQLYAMLDCRWVPDRPHSHVEPFRKDDVDPRLHDARNAPPERQSVASSSNKFHQLSLAARVGFTIPRTLFTNSPDQFLDFYEACDGKLITKRAVDLFPVIDGQLTRTYTVPVRRRDAAHAAALRYAPAQFQEMIAKRVELRVTVVGAKVFAAEIRSQESFRQTTDWRHVPAHAQSQFYAVHALPAAVEQRCVAVVAALGLSLGAIDLILTPDDDYVFLEVNPNGQWAYIEDMLGFPISGAIAELLCADGA